jgi:pyruvate dehydrogenase E2 component (dihydrolipoamide acetyltransferase)
MPKLGLTMEEATIISWLKKEGDEVSEGEAILTIETDKVTVEVETPSSGTLGPIFFPEGATVSVGQVITYILALGEEAPEVQPLSQPPSTQGKMVARKIDHPTARSKEGSGRSAVSPVARRLADELGVDLTKVEGTGPQGRIMEEDVRREAEGLQPGPERTLTPDSLTHESQTSPLQGMRRVMANRMIQSFTTAPHFYLSVEVDASLLLVTREDLMGPIEERSRVRLTISDLLIKLTGQALQEHPEVNVVWDRVGVRSLAAANVGLAVATDRGLIVPVFRDVNRKSLSEIVAERQVLVEKARDGKLSLQDIEGGSFTVSNLGTFAVDQFNAIINPPQAAILAVGQIKQRPFAENGQLAVRSTMYLTLSVDHRILDGAEAARFLDRLGALIEEPDLMGAPPGNPG